MLIFLKAAGRIARIKLAEYLAHRADVYMVRVWHSALEREERVREILGAHRHESTDEAAWRVVGERQA